MTCRNGLYNRLTMSTNYTRVNNIHVLATITNKMTKGTDPTVKLLIPLSHALQWPVSHVNPLPMQCVILKLYTWKL